MSDDSHSRIIFIIEKKLFIAIQSEIVFVELILFCLIVNGVSINRICVNINVCK